MNAIKFLTGHTNFSQQQNPVLRGTVADASVAVIPGASLTPVN